METNETTINPYEWANRGEKVRKLADFINSPAIHTILTDEVLAAAAIECGIKTPSHDTCEVVRAHIQLGL